MTDPQPEYADDLARRILGIEQAQEEAHQEADAALATLGYTHTPHPTEEGN